MSEKVCGNCGDILDSEEALLQHQLFENLKLISQSNSNLLNNMFFEYRFSNILKIMGQGVTPCSFEDAYKKHRQYWGEMVALSDQEQAEQKAEQK